MKRCTRARPAACTHHASWRLIMLGREQGRQKQEADCGRPASLRAAAPGGGAPASHARSMGWERHGLPGHCPPVGAAPRSGGMGRRGDLRLRVAAGVWVCWRAAGCSWCSRRERIVDGVRSGSKRGGGAPKELPARHPCLWDRLACSLAWPPPWRMPACQAGPWNTAAAAGGGRPRGEGGGEGTRALNGPHPRRRRRSVCMHKMPPPRRRQPRGWAAGSPRPTTVL